MKIKYAFLIIMITLFQTTSALSQPPASLPGLIFQDWKILGESSKHIDVFHRLIKCNNVNQIHIKLLNESGIDQTLQFELKITNNETGDTFSKQSSISLFKSQTVQSDCNSPVADQLKFDLPSTYNPMKTTVQITFKQ